MYALQLRECSVYIVTIYIQMYADMCVLGEGKRKIASPEKTERINSRAAPVSLVIILEINIEG